MNDLFYFKAYKLAGISGRGSSDGNRNVLYRFGSDVFYRPAGGICDEHQYPGYAPSAGCGGRKN